VTPIGPARWSPGPVPDNGRPAAAQPGPVAGSPFGAAGPAWPAPASASPGPVAGSPFGAGGPAWSGPQDAADAPPPGGGLAGRPPATAADDDVARRTPSGLVKRTPRVVDTGEMQAIGRHPDDDLLASLSRVTRDRPPEGPGNRQQPPTPPPGTFAPPWPPEPAAPPSPAPPLAPQRPAGAPLGGLAAGLSGLSPFDPRGAGSHRAPASDPEGGSTTGGLTRRVRGAQLPNTNPVSLRRADGPPPTGSVPAPAAPGRAAPPPPPPRTPQQRQSADAVYSFLTNFTAGVQRGLDEAREG
jgi:hypothetical protein